jgi:hypothetical protein
MIWKSYQMILMMFNMELCTVYVYIIRKLTFSAYICGLK